MLLTMFNKPGTYNNTLFKGYRYSHHSFSAISSLIILLHAFSLLRHVNSDLTKVWVGTWSTAPQLAKDLMLLTSK
jgi:hypothetical protein